MKRVNNAHKFEEVEGLTGFEKSITQPDQAMSVKEIARRFTRGETMKEIPWFFQGDITTEFDEFDFDRVQDLTRPEIDEAYDRVQQEIKDLQDWKTKFDEEVAIRS